MNRIIIKQELMTQHGWERPHKYNIWTYQDWSDVSNKYKFDVSFMTMMEKLMRGTDVVKAWLKKRNNFMKILQEPTLPKF